MGDVREGAAVHEGRGAFQGLHQVGLQGVAQQGCHRAGRLQVARGHGLVVVGIGHDDPAQPFLQVLHRGSQAEHRHDLAGDGDVESVLTRNAVRLSAQAVHHEPQLPVVHVHAALPGDLLHIDTQGVPLLDMIVQHGGQQVVRGADGVEVTGEMQVDIFHRDHLGISAAGGAAFDAEHRAEARLTQRDGDVLADAAQAVRQADGRRGLALAGGGGRDRRHQHQLAGLPVGLLDQRGIDLGLVPAVLFHVLLVDVGPVRDLHDRLHFTLLRNLDVG